MRNHRIAGAAIAAGGALLIVVGGLLDLEVQTAAWVGLALGAALALVPDRTPGGRLAAAAPGVLAALVGYALRALVLPGSATGNAIAFLAVIALCTVVVGLAARRLVLWASLLGAWTPWPPSFRSTDTLADGTGRLDAGAREPAEGSGTLNDGAGRLADGTRTAGEGGIQLADGAAELAEGLGDAGDGSELLADGLGEAAGAAPAIPERAQRLSDEGTSLLVEAGASLLVEAGASTALDYGKMVAVMQAGAERADAESMAAGAPGGCCRSDGLQLHPRRGRRGSTQRDPRHRRRHRARRCRWPVVVAPRSRSLSPAQGVRRTAPYPG